MNPSDELRYAVQEHIAPGIWGVVAYTKDKDEAIERAWKDAGYGSSMRVIDTYEDVEIWPTAEEK